MLATDFSIRICLPNLGAWLQASYVERATLLLTFIDTYSYLPYLCTEYPYISTDSFLSV